MGKGAPDTDTLWATAPPVGGDGADGKSVTSQEPNGRRGSGVQRRRFRTCPQRIAQNTGRTRAWSIRYSAFTGGPRPTRAPGPPPPGPARPPHAPPP